MGWHKSSVIRAVQLARPLFALAACLLTAPAAKAQYTPTPPFLGPGFYTGTNVDDEWWVIGNPYLEVAEGIGKKQGGSFGVWSTSKNPTDPGTVFLGAGTGSILLNYSPLISPLNPPQFMGSRCFLRVDGGKYGGSGGYDYELGNPDITKGGEWLLAPTQIGNHLYARWTTVPGATFVSVPNAQGIGSSKTGGLIQDPMIEVDITISFVHDLARFEFDIINNDPGHTHTVGLAFLQEDIPNNNNPAVGFPVRLGTQGSALTEITLSGSQIPAYYTTQQILSNYDPATGNPPQVHTIKGLLRPTATSINEPTTPTRFTIGNDFVLEGNNAYSTTIRDYEAIWNYALNTKATNGSQEESIMLYWDSQVIPPISAPVKIVTYVGQDTASHDVGTPMTLSVSSLAALTLNTTSPTSNLPSPFTITAFVDNLTDLGSSTSNSADIGPVSLALDLPTGLKLATGDTLTKQIVSLIAGSESNVSWNVVADGTANGPLTYTVTATPSIGVGKIVQRTIQVPAAPAINLKGTASSQGHYQMITLPFQFGQATPTQILFPNLGSNLAAPDLAQWNPTLGNYAPVTTFVPGQAYWIRSRVATDQHILINATTFPPLANQTGTTGASFKATYGQGWNQIGNPYLYSIYFSDVQVYDPTSQQVYTLQQAADPSVNLIEQAIYYYDTSDPTPTNWQYVQEGIGFQMAPYQGYWVYVKRAGLEFIYPAVTTPGALVVTRASLQSAGLSSQLGRGIPSNWRLKLEAEGASGKDLYTYIGVAPKAQDTLDAYKLSKPPMINKQVTMAVVHPEWTKGGRLAQDLRSPGTTVKTFDLQVTSGNANEDVTVRWPQFASSIPRNYKLTLIDPVANSQIDMSGRQSYRVNTGSTGTRSLQIVATPNQRANHVDITSFNVDMGRAVASRTVTINYALSGDAQTYIMVRDGRGRTVRTLEPTARATGTPNQGSMLWDMRNQQGTALATGTYSIELHAVTTSGQHTRESRTLVISR